MRPARIFAALALLTLPAVVHAQNGCARLSWGSCDPWCWNSPYLGHGVYTLVESMYGVSAPNVGTDTQITIGFVIPDAWRFDGDGCQGGSRLSADNNALDASCPAMKGTNAVPSVQYTVDANHFEAVLRLTTTYDLFIPDPTSRYTAWQIHFDHSHSQIGPTPPDLSVCGGVEQCLLFQVDFAQVLTTGGQWLSLDSCDPFNHFLQSAAWNGSGCVPEGGYSSGCDPVPALPATWGRVKSLYR